MQEGIHILDPIILLRPFEHLYVDKKSTLCLSRNLYKEYTLGVRLYLL